VKMITVCFENMALQVPSSICVKKYQSLLHMRGFLFHDLLSFALVDLG
jgi:hypothetical protein